MKLKVECQMLKAAKIGSNFRFPDAQVRTGIRPTQHMFSLDAQVHLGPRQPQPAFLPQSLHEYSFISFL
jgi:hypothetical protein